MNIETKFNIGDKAWPACRESKARTIPCAGCGATGEIKLMDSTLSQCPKCHGWKHKKEWEAMVWHVGSALTIGQVNIRIPGYDHDRDESYMCNETGVGSGTNHRVENMFHSEAGAQTECDRRNEKEG